jgi:asparagine N-glycosylation enzyme membrane subunit Stt3
MDEEIDLKEKREEVVKGIKKFFSKVKKEISSKDEADNSEEVDLKEKREQLINFLRQKKNWIVYVILGVIIWFGSFIRTRNLGLLRDATTGKYLPLALDPHIFLKYAQYILEKGSLMAHDFMRFVPYGAPTINYAFMSYFIVYLYKFIHFFAPSVTLEFVDIIYPVICFAIGILFFFLLVRRLFDKKVALLASLFLAIVPAFLHRTMAGFSDHEALGTMLMFMAMYFYVLGWQSNKLKGNLGWGLLAGVFTGFMGLSWGGWKFLLLIISLFVLIEFFFDKIEKKDTYQYFAWVFGFVYISTVWLPQFSIRDLLGSFTTGISFLVMFMLIVDLVLFKYDVFKIKNKVKGKIPLSVVGMVVSLVVGISFLGMILGPGTLFTQVEEIGDSLLHPMGNDRWQLTVAEQHQPYFKDLVGHFGPQFFNIPIYLVLFMSGSVILFYLMVKKLKKRILMTVIYLCFLLAFVLSRHSPSSLFNGTNFISKLVYLGSLGIFMGLAIIFYFRSFYKDKETYSKILSMDKKYIFVLVWFLIMIVAARGAARLIFIFTPITAVLSAFAVVWLSEFAWRIKQKWYRYAGIALLFLVLLSPFSYPITGMVPYFSEASLNEGTYSGPGYNQQWQLAGKWVRDNVDEKAVFGHWWDYGYWVQGGFQRAAVLDGANKIKYWNYLMGRHVLCGQNQTEALEFLKVHDTTHYLIVSDEIGKYTAYSSIGSDKDNDRYSWITTFKMDPQATQETRNETVFVYQGGYVLDDDFIWDEVIYPRGGAGIGAVFLPVQERKTQIGNETKVGLEIKQPTVALFYQGKRVDLPLECVYFNGEMIKFEKPGLKGCFRLVPTLTNEGQPDNLFGAGMYVSEEGVNALWTNLYVFEQNNPDYDTSAFKSVYSDSYISHLALFRGRLIGPIKVWEIEYPTGFTVDSETTAKYLGGNELLEDWFFDV